jgi:hypothetical protein
MGLGLAVVSGGIDVVKKSKIRDFIQYYDIDTPEALAAAILKVGDRMNVEKNKSIILQLDEEFILDIKSFLKAEY